MINDMDIMSCRVIIFRKNDQTRFFRQVEKIYYPRHNFCHGNLILIYVNSERYKEITYMMKIIQGY